MMNKARSPPSWSLHFKEEAERKQMSVIMTYHNLWVTDEVRKKIQPGKDMEGSVLFKGGQSGKHPLGDGI